MTTSADNKGAGESGGKYEILDLPVLITSVHVLVVGDVMLDEYIIGSVSRISPEAPVPVLDLNERRHRAGGAANVALNVAGLRARASLVGLVGCDASGGLLGETLRGSGVGVEELVRCTDRPTTVKTRIVAGQQQIVRVDEEIRRPAESSLVTRIVKGAGRLMGSAGACVLSDYGKGMLVPEVCADIIDLGRERGIPVIVDPKGRCYEKYRGCSVITPNEREAALAAGIEIDSEEDLFKASEILLRQLPGTSLLVTRGAKGMTLFRETAKPLTIPTEARAVFDVVGAGDTVVAVLAAAVAAGFPLPFAVRLANTAAGLVVEKHGTVAIQLDELVGQRADAPASCLTE